MDEQTIKSAYGIHWDTVKNHVDENGWVRDIYCGPNHSLSNIELEWKVSTFCRPLVLKELEEQ